MSRVSGLAVTAAKKKKKKKKKKKFCYCNLTLGIDPIPSLGRKLSTEYFQKQKYIMEC